MLQLHKHKDGNLEVVEHQELDLLVVLEEFLCGASDSFLFSDSHTFRSAAMCFVAAIANFRKNQCLSVHHDQVNLTKPAGVVALKCPQPAFVQKGFGKLFPLPPL